MRKLALAAALTLLTATARADEASDVAAALTPHLNAHGKHFVAAEAKRLAIGDASESGAKDDVRDACPQPASCFDTSKMSPDEVMAAMLLLSAQRAQTQLQQQIDRIKDRSEHLKRLTAQLQNETDKDRLAGLKREIDKLNAGSQLDMIELQSLMNKRNQAQEMLSNLLQKFQKTLDGIVGNMR